MKRWATWTAAAALLATESVLAEDRLDLNEAGMQRLADLLKGVGEVKAEAIVEYREENGGFDSVDELAEVNGIGDVTVSDNHDLLTVSQ